MSLPVVRLAVVSNTNVTAVSDPKQATLTLYAFLKSVPTSSECSYAFQDLKRNLAAADIGSGFMGDKRYGGVSNRSPKFEALLHRIELVTRPYYSSQAPKMLHPLPDGNSGAHDGGRQKRQKVIREFLQGKKNEPKLEITTTRPNDNANLVNSCATPVSGKPHYRELIDNIAGSRVPREQNSKCSDDTYRQESPAHLTGSGRTEGRVDLSYKDSGANEVFRGYPRALGTVLRDIQNGLDTYTNSSSLISAEEADRKQHEISAMNRNKTIDLLTRLEAIKETVPSSSVSNMPAKVISIVSELMQRVRNVQIVQQLEQHEADTLKLTELGLRAECAALKKQCKDVVSCVVRCEARLTGEDNALPPTDRRYVSEHCLFEGVQESLHEATQVLS
eukprot:Tbor_TRINITY_DN4769_c0_g1::TRINITY_DN4769_c0_g1_i1::g.17006::m.17006